MRLTSLLILAALLLGVGYVAIFKRDWVMNLFRSGAEAAEGYTNAESPRQAMDLFTKAVHARKFKTAARYVKGNYKEQLERAHEAAAEMGALLDKIVRYARNKGFDSDTTLAMLARLDPFPPYFEVEGEPIPDKKDAGKAYGRCKPAWSYLHPDVRELNGLGLTLPSQPLTPATWYTGTPLVEEHADGKQWKLHIEVTTAQVNAISEYLNRYRSYQSALENFHRDMTNNRHDTKEEFKSRLLEVVRASK